MNNKLTEKSENWNTKVKIVQREQQWKHAVIEDESGIKAVGEVGRLISSKRMYVF